MRKIIIGSVALKYHFPDFDRENADIDYLVEKETKSTKLVEHHVIPPLWKRIKPDQEYLTPDQLYTLKVSHSYWNIFWNKTIYDILFLKEKGCKLDEELHNELYLYWIEKHGPKNVNLNKNNNEFFGKYVEREFDHDLIHELVKYYEEPLYKDLLIDPNKPLINKTKFFLQSHLDQIRTVKEEGYTLGLERHYLPGNTNNIKVAYMRALKILITSASKGWFPTFIVDNYKEISELDLNTKEIRTKLKHLL